MPTDPTIRDCEITLHGNVVADREAGLAAPSGADAAPVPTMVLLHGIASNNETWDPVLAQFAKTHRVIAPDLIGHGRSAKPMGDYSIGGFATVIRDLLLTLGVDRVTLVGHSLGGGIAMQLLHMAPDLIGRLVLVGSGGLGPDLGLPLRAASLPGAPIFIRAATSMPAQAAGRAVHKVLDAVHLDLPTDVEEGLGGFTSLHDADARKAFLNTVRASTDLGGQRVSAVDKLYLMGDCPMLTVWGADDRIIPVAHAYEAQRLVPHMEIAVIQHAGHFPHRDDPERFAALVHEFEAATESSTLTLQAMADIIRDDAPEPATVATEPLADVVPLDAAAATRRAVRGSGPSAAGLPGGTPLPDTEARAALVADPSSV